MPTYVYKFIDSGETIEIQQAFTDESLTSLAHPSDGTVRPVKKVFTPVGVSFKGNGFYKTDSRSGASSTPATPATPAGSSSDGSSLAATTTPAPTPVTAPASAPAPAPASTPASTPAK